MDDSSRRHRSARASSRAHEHREGRRSSKRIRTSKMSAPDELAETTPVRPSRAASQKAYDRIRRSTQDEDDDEFDDPPSTTSGDEEEPEASRRATRNADDIADSEAEDSPQKPGRQAAAPSNRSGNLIVKLKINTSRLRQSKRLSQAGDKHLPNSEMEVDESEQDDEAGESDDDIPVKGGRARKTVLPHQDAASDNENQDDDDDGEEVVPANRQRGRLRSSRTQAVKDSDDDDPPFDDGSGSDNQPAAKKTPAPTRRPKKKKDSDSEFSAYDDPDEEDEEDLEDQHFVVESDEPEQYESRRRKQPSTRTTRNSARSRDIESDSSDADYGRRGKRGRPYYSHEAVDDYHERHSRRVRDRPDYRIIRPEMNKIFEDDSRAKEDANANARGPGSGFRNFIATMAGMGGGNPGAVGHDTDSSDDGMAMAGGGGNGGSKALPMGGPQGMGVANYASLGQIKDRQALADSDPLGVDPNVTFDGVGGLDDHINQLKEMVMLPLLYPEVFQQFKITPPRGVLFHGPPGTGKTLLARALASSVSSQGKKVTFYMRKGADALSKWVGEAERQLRLLFEDARKNQPSIIFFDEIDGLAPVRSSKQEQIHASIVATILALMDGMDGRGQVIVIGATNRPDNVDPALRRPGRFDREFYFPLPSKEARREIINIHTKGWEPPLADGFKDQLAELTKGYGGADLRALCTEAALNAVQGTFPQIYESNAKLRIEPSEIRVQARDFMVSVDKIVPSSARATGSIATALTEDAKALLGKSLENALSIAQKVLPIRKKRTALEEAKYERDDESTMADVDSTGFEVELRNQRLFQSRLFRPRLLLRGRSGNGQASIASALLHSLDGVHIQSCGLPAVLADSSRSPEAAIVQLFAEGRQRQPSILFIPDVDIWLETIPPSAVRTFLALLRSVPPNEAVMVLGTIEDTPGLSKDTDLETLIAELFGKDPRGIVACPSPDKEARYKSFQSLVDYIALPPNQFPDQVERKRRVLPELEVLEENAGDDEYAGLSTEAIKEREKQKRIALSHLRLVLQPVITHIRNKFKKLRAPVISDSAIKYLIEPEKPAIEKAAALLTTNIAPKANSVQKQAPEPEKPKAPQERLYELAHDEDGNPGLREIKTDRFFYNIDTVTIERRLANGDYLRPVDFVADIERLVADAKEWGDEERIVKANEMMAHVDVDIQYLEQQNQGLLPVWEDIYQREKNGRREKRLADMEAHKKAQAALPPPVPTAPGSANASLKDTSELVWELPKRSGSKATQMRTIIPILQSTAGTPLPIPASSPTPLSLGSTAVLQPHTPDFASVVPAIGSTSAGSSLPDTQESAFEAQYRAANATSGPPSKSNGSGNGNGPSFPLPALPLNGYPNGTAPFPVPTMQYATMGQAQAQIYPMNDNNGVPAPSLQAQAASFVNVSTLPAHAACAPAEPRRPDGSGPGSDGSMGSIRQRRSNSGSGAAPSAAGSADTVREHPPLKVSPGRLAVLHAALVARTEGYPAEDVMLLNARLVQVVWDGRAEWDRDVVLDSVAAAMEELAG